MGEEVDGSIVCFLEFGLRDGVETPF